MVARELSAAELLGVWERGARTGAIERAVTLLGEVHGTPAADVLRWPVGERDARLLSFRAHTFGPVLEFLADCPNCDETVEAELPIDELLAQHGDSAAFHEARLGDDDVTVRFRAVTSADVLHALAGDGERTLLDRCVVSVNGATDTMLDPLIARALADADPLADIRVDLTCPSCDERWAATLDAASFVWSEIDAWAQRMLQEVDILARAYGWSERDILSLGAARRAAYLELRS